MTYMDVGHPGLEVNRAGRLVQDELRSRPKKIDKGRFISNSVQAGSAATAQTRFCSMSMRS